jgi:hypothetical protein
MIETEIQLKVNDVYSFRYNEEEIKKRFEPYHCFDGQLVVKKRHDESLYLVDTYWGSGDNRVFSLEKALKEGTLTYKCNLDDVETIREHEFGYYADDDLFNLSHQHGCYKHYAKKKGVERSKEKMLETINKKISETEYEMDYAARNIISLNERKQKIIDGDLTTYI